MKAFKRSSFSPHNHQPLTLLLLIQGLFRATACALQQLNLFFPNFYKSPACSILSGLPCLTSPTHSSQGCHQKWDSGTAVCLPTKIKPQEGQIGEEWTWVFCGIMHFVERYSAIRCPIWSCHLQYAVLCLHLHIKSSLLAWFFNLALPAICCDGDTSRSSRSPQIASRTNKLEMWLGQKKWSNYLVFFCCYLKFHSVHLTRKQIHQIIHLQMNSWTGSSLV